MINTDQIIDQVIAYVTAFKHGQVEHADMHMASIRALLADATQARAAVEAEQSKTQAHALAEEVKTAWGRQDPKRLWTAVEALEALAAQTPGEGWIRVETLQALVTEWDRLFADTKYELHQIEAWENFEFRQMNDIRAAVKCAPKPPATPGEA